MSLFSQYIRNPKKVENGRSVVQTNLSIGQPNDPFEQEADAVADRIMKIPSNATPGIQRKCDQCEEEEMQMKPSNRAVNPIVQKQTNDTSRVAAPDLSQTLSQSKGGGQNMDAGTQSFMNTNIGADFSRVKIHTDDKAIQMNRQLHARAFTHGSDVYFDRGQYDPNSSKGKHLLAHELTHVVQQTNTIQPYRKSDSFNFGTVDAPPMWVEQEFTNPGDKASKPWIEHININFTSTTADAKGNDTQIGTMDVIYSKNGHELGDFSIPISGGSTQVGRTDAGSFTVHRIEGWGYNSGKFSDLSDKIGPKKRYSRPGEPANMHLAVFYNQGEAIHLGILNESSHGCVHIDPNQDLQMREINYHSVIGLTQVKVTRP